MVATGVENRTISPVGRVVITLVVNYVFVSCPVLTRTLGIDEMLNTYSISTVGNFQLIDDVDAEEVNIKIFTHRYLSKDSLILVLDWQGANYLESEVVIPVSTNSR